MRITIMDRRRFVARAATASAVVMVSAAGAVTIGSTEAAWALSLDTVDAPGATRLMAMIKTLYPHDRLGDVYYADALGGLDKKAGGDAALKSLLVDGSKQLDQKGKLFAELNEEQRVAVLKGLETTPFFRRVANEMLVAFYNNKNIWTEFEYQGASFEQGGYIQRGFQDATWTGDPPADVSPPPYTG